MGGYEGPPGGQQAGRRKRKPPKAAVVVRRKLASGASEMVFLSDREGCGEAQRVATPESAAPAARSVPRSRRDYGSGIRSVRRSTRRCDGWMPRAGLHTPDPTDVFTSR